MFRTLRKMADDGRTVIFISHKMNEVMEHSDRITVLKGGKVEDKMLARDATIGRLTKAVVGSGDHGQNRAEAGGGSEENAS